MKRMPILMTMVAIAVSLAFSAIAADDPEPTVEFGPAPVQGELTASPLNTSLKITIANIKTEAVLMVETLSAEMKTQIPGSPEQLQFQRRIREVKINSEVAILQAVSADAMVRNDQVTVAEADLALDRILHPENFAPVLNPVDRSAHSNN